MKLNIVKSKNCTILYAARSYRSESGKSTSKVVKRLGTVEELRGKLNGEDPIEWAKTQVAGITALEKEGNKHVIIDCNPMALISKGERRSYNGGRWIIENGFRIMKTDFDARPSHLLPGTAGIQVSGEESEPWREALHNR
ncbi:hypothetical protein [Proteiniphilum sp. X52]|uniref:hypothetical protein n=1 Tax=Proteiniphilum sp. X52 TaxID=2382159 RepID=UPI0016240D7A|nr:hypothetical protein [Proteiniphilum sp. X52]